MSLYQTKRRRERELEIAYESIPLELTIAQWLSSKEYRKFIDAWKALREVYIESDDFTEFNVDIIDIYRNITAYFRDLAANSTLEPETREIVSDALAEIEIWMDELTKEAQRNLYLIEDTEDEV